MSKESEFFIYLIERYADYKNITATEVVKLWNELSVKDLIYDMYELYHIERLENAFEDIDKIVREAYSSLDSLKIEVAAKQILEKYRPAFEKLAK